MTAVIAAGVVVGLAGVGGTYSFLSARATSPTSVVKAGSLNLTVDGGQSAVIPAFQLAPSSWQLRSVTVMNTGDAPATLTASTAITSTDPLSADAVARLTTVPFGSSCVAGAAVPTTPITGFTTGVGSLAPGARIVLCLEVGLRPGTSADRSGQAVAFQLTLAGQQQAG
ncbi:TasA family protein [Microbacterium sp. ZW T5_56]|uniref:TasA family protein n=1 Tax=Microbacterium sp. ZW T5_56 TaxID=3378081 RepID=UPI003853352D